MGDALHTDGGVTSAQEARIADAGLLAVDGPGAFDVRTGVLVGPGSTDLVSGTTTTAPSWTYQIAPHNWVTSRGAANGPYRGALEQATTVSTALPPASNSRIDVVWVKQGDAAAGVPAPDGATAPVYGVTSGAAAPSPTKPAIPVGAVEIATAVVPSTATGGTAGAGVVITQTALQTVARGGVLPLSGQAEQDAVTGYPGMWADRTDTSALLRHDGGEFREVEQAGQWVSYTPTWTAGALAPSVGNGTLRGRWKRVGQTLIAVRITLVMGSTSSGGTGGWAFALPVPASGVDEQELFCRANVSGAQDYVGFSLITPGASVTRPYLPLSPTDSRVGNTRNLDDAQATGSGIPDTGAAIPWEAGRFLVVQGVYESAS